ncbi:MAG: tetratricopeptide repeat protein [bacterium]|nr:tetratricopeptide repeat protein [bacterium]
MNKKMMIVILTGAVLCIISTVSLAQYGEGLTVPTSENPDYQPPSKEISIYNLGINALSNNDYDQALEYFMKALKQDKNNADAMIMIGYTQIQLANPDDAIANLQAALKIQPRSAKARQYLGEAYIRAAVQEMDILNSYGEDGQDQLQDLGVYFTTTYENLIKCKYCTVPAN